MAEYYLVSQLPSLDGISENTPMPITEERFLELCNRFLGEKARSEMRKLTLVPPILPEKTGSKLIDAFNEGERNLRLALGKARAEKMKKSFNTRNAFFPIELTRAVGAAVESESPMEAEKLLFDYRLSFLETLRPMDTFSEDYVFYYGLKLKLILRIRRFETELGEAVYRNIYNSVLNGDRLEAM